MATRKVRQHREVQNVEGRRPLRNQNGQRDDYDAAVREAAAQAVQKQLVAERQGLVNGFPLRGHIPRHDTTRWIGDRVVDAKHLSYRSAAIGVLGAGGTAGMLNAYSQQENEGGDTGIIAIMGRGERNSLDASGAAIQTMVGDGIVPLAQARMNECARS